MQSPDQFSTSPVLPTDDLYRTAGWSTPLPDNPATADHKSPHWQPNVAVAAGNEGLETHRRLRHTLPLSEEDDGQEGGNEAMEAAKCLLAEKIRSDIIAQPSLLTSAWSFAEDGEGESGSEEEDDEEEDEDEGEEEEEMPKSMADIYRIRYRRSGCSNSSTGSSGNFGRCSSSPSLHPRYSNRNRRRNKEKKKQQDTGSEAEDEGEDKGSMLPHSLQRQSSQGLPPAAQSPEPSSGNTAPGGVGGDPNIDTYFVGCKRKKHDAEDTLGFMEQIGWLSEDHKQGILMGQAKGGGGLASGGFTGGDGGGEDEGEEEDMGHDARGGAGCPGWPRRRQRGVGDEG